MSNHCASSTAIAKTKVVWDDHFTLPYALFVFDNITKDKATLIYGKTVETLQPYYGDYMFSLNFLVIVAKSAPNSKLLKIGKTLKFTPQILSAIL